MYSSSLFQSPGTFRETQNTLDMITTHFIELLRLKSKELYDHSVRVANYAGATAVYMRLPANEITLIRYAGLLHDIGLLTIPNHILTKVPYLSRRELSLYKSIRSLGPICWNRCRAVRTFSLISAATTNDGTARDIRSI